MTVKELIARSKAAQAEFAFATQEQADAAAKAICKVVYDNAEKLGPMAAEESRMGSEQDKIAKCRNKSALIWESLKGKKSCDIINRIEERRMIEVAKPVGVVASIIPSTNPVVTPMSNGAFALKCRNSVIFAPHPRAVKCTKLLVEMFRAELKKLGLPEDLVLGLEEVSNDLTSELMSAADMVVATGGMGMVKAAYSSGKPALGVGAGNTPALIDETADIQMAVSSILMSKTFDNGMICASEQSVTAVKDVYDAVKAEFVKRGAYILTPKEKEKLAKVIMIDGHLNAAIVGQPAYKIAEMAKISVPEETKVLIAECTKVGAEEPFSAEKLSPVLAMYKVDDFKSGADLAKALVSHGGKGHTSVLYTNPQNDDRIKYFGHLMITGRVMINCPSSQGAIGDIYNFRLEPSLTLGCGSWGGNSVSENVGVKHLMNIKNVAKREENMLWFRIPPKVYFKPGSLSFALKELKGKKRAFIVTDKPLFDLGYTKKVTDVLDEIGVAYKIFSDVHPDPDLTTVNMAIGTLRSFEPDVIIALGGGSPIDAGKIMWLMYEHPELKFEDLAMRFMDIRKRIFEFPQLGEKAVMVAIPTTSGTGSEVTPFSIITDDHEGVKYAVADYALTPSMAIIDSDLVQTMPKGLCSASGIDILTHALESYVSSMATEYTRGLSLEAGKLVFDYLPSSYATADSYAREKVHTAATLAGMAFANAFLGVCHSMAHKLGSHFNIPHGVANALLICQVIRFNATDKPAKQCAFPQYKFPHAKAAYAEFAAAMGFKGKTDDEKVNALVEAIKELKTKIGIPGSIREWFAIRGEYTDEDFKKAMETLPTLAFDDQCTGSNPRYPLIKEIRKLYELAYEGVTDFEI